VSASKATASPTPRLIRIERRGGLAGLRARFECEYSALTAAQRAALDQLLGSRGDSAKAAPAARSPGADRFRYLVHVTDAAGTETNFEVDEDHMPSPLEALAKPQLP